MAFENVRYEKDRHIVRLTLNRPDALNAINQGVLEDLNDAFEAIEKDKEVRVVILTGEGRAFSAGFDLKVVVSEELLRFWQKTLNRFEDLPVCTIAAINGFALAGGLELVMCCDLAILSQEAQIGDQHANFGLMAGGGGTQRLPRALGVRKAKEIMYSGDWISPQDALNFGLVNKVVPADKLEEEVVALAKRLSEKSPLATATVKRLINKGMQVDLHSGLEMELSSVVNYITSEDYKEGLAAFNEKRAPQFKGR